jgi:hypothetical protein
MYADKFSEYLESAYKLYKLEMEATKGVVVMGFAKE